jgi:endonuclease-8
VPEGDTLFRIAEGLRPYLLDRVVVAATARQPGPRAGLLVGTTIVSVEARGKNLLVGFDSGLELRTHLGMHGSWHRYRPGEPWRRAPARARIVLEVPGSVAVCFDAPTVELLEVRAEHLHRPLGGLGPDLLGPTFDETDGLGRLRAPERAGRSIAEALLDQRAVAGIGNVYCDETLFLEGVDPFAPVESLADEALVGLVRRARGLLLANRDHADRVTTPDAVSRTGRRLWVYGRAGRPCLRCGSRLVARRHGTLPRRRTWCPRCQASPGHATSAPTPLSVGPVSPAGAASGAGAGGDGDGDGRVRSGGVRSRGVRSRGVRSPG